MIRMATQLFVITQHMIIIIMGVILPQLALCRCWLAAVRACRLAAAGLVPLLARRRPYIYTGSPIVPSRAIYIYIYQPDGLFRVVGSDAYI